MKRNGKTNFWKIGKDLKRNWKKNWKRIETIWKKIKKNWKKKIEKEFVKKNWKIICKRIEKVKQLEKELKINWKAI